MSDKGEKKPQVNRGKKRRWLRWSLYSLALLVIFVLLSPYLISTGPGTSLAMAIVNSRIRGEASIDDLSMGWFGTTEIHGLKLLDGNGREVFIAGKITYPGGMWRMITSVEDFGRLEMRSCQVTVYGSGASIADAISSPGPSKPRPEGKPLPNFKGNVVLKDGSVLAVSAEGDRYRLSNINGELAVNSLNDIRGELEMETAESGRIISKVELLNMAAGGRVKLKQADGLITIRTEQPMNAGAAAQFFTGKACRGGKLSFTSETTFKAGRMESSFDATLTDVQALECDGSQAVSINATCKGNAVMRGDALAWKADLAGTSNEFNLSVTGEADLQNKTFKCKSRGGTEDLAAFSRLAEAFGMDRLKGYTGSIDFSADVARQTANEPILSSGDFHANGLRHNNRIIGDGKAVLVWEDFAIPTSSDELRIKLLELNSGIATAKVSNLNIQPGDKAAASGKADITADLQPCLDAIAPFSQWKETPKLAGRLNWSGAASTAGDLLTVIGDGHIAGFRLGEGEKAVAEDMMTFTTNVELNKAIGRILVKEFGLSSKLLTVNMTGTVEDYRKARKLDFTGHYSGSWEQLTALIQQLAPKTAENVAFAGTTSGDFTITGTAYDPELRPAYRDVTANGSFGWDSGKLFGFDIGKAIISPSLRDGQLDIPVTEIPAAGGKMRLGGLVDLRPETPLLQIPGKLVLLEGMQINREVGRQLLSRFVPIFGKLHSLEGEITMTTTDLQFPLGEAIKQAGSGSGVIDLSKIRLQPEGVMKELLRLGGLGDTAQYDVKASDLNFTVSQGRIHYKDFTLNFANMYDLKSSGSVGFDDTVDAVISVPVRAALLEKLGIKGSALDYAKALEGVRVNLRLVGTRDNLRLDYSKINAVELITRAMEAILSEKARKDDNKKDQNESPATGNEPETDEPQPDTKPAEDKKSDKEKLIEDIFDILQNVLDKSDESEKDDAETN